MLRAPTEMEAWGSKGATAAAAAVGRRQQDGRAVVRECLKGVEQLLGVPALRLMTKLVMAGEGQRQKKRREGEGALG